MTSKLRSVCEERAKGRHSRVLRSLSKQLDGAVGSVSRRFIASRVVFKHGVCVVA